MAHRNSSQIVSTPKGSESLGPLKTDSERPELYQILKFAAESQRKDISDAQFDAYWEYPGAWGDEEEIA